MKELSIYAKEVKKHSSGDIEMDFLAKLEAFDRAAFITGIETIDTTTNEQELNQSIPQQDALVAAMAAQHPAAAPVIQKNGNPATNWWLALIAFLLFMILCNMGE